MYYKYFHSLANILVLGRKWNIKYISLQSKSFPAKILFSEIQKKKISEKNIYFERGPWKIDCIHTDLNLQQSLLIKIIQQKIHPRFHFPGIEHLISELSGFLCLIQQGIQISISGVFQES